MTRTDQQSDTHWMVRLAESDLFRQLPAASMGILLEQFDKISVKAGDVIIHQGDLGDYYYVIESGRCEVTRKDAATDSVRHLATLGPGEAFGEEDTASGSSRNASVTMTEDGELLRLRLETFNDVVRDALIDKVPFRIAERMQADGAHWLDVRSSEDFEKLPRFKNSFHLPLSTLRESYADVLSTERSYIVCAEEHSVAAVATLLLVQRDIDAVCLNEPISAMAPAMAEVESDENVVAFPSSLPSNSANQDAALVEQARAHESKLGDLESDEPIPRDLYDDTYVGQSLADLIDQMHTRHHDLLTASPTADDTATASDTIDVAAFEQTVEQDLARHAEDAPEKSAVADPTSHHADAISGYLGKLDDLIRQQVEARVAHERVLIRQRSEKKVAAIRKTAIEEVKKQTARYRDKLRHEHEEKHLILKAQYDKLMGLAHRISRQKAELKNARAQIQDKLQAATQLQDELNSLRANLSESIGTFDSLDESENSQP